MWPFASRAGASACTVALILSVVGLSAAGPALGAQTVTEWPAPTANRGPLLLAAGPDGNVWFVQGDSPGYLARTTPSGEIKEFEWAFSSAPLGITAGPDGNLWLTEPTAAKIARVTLSGTVTQFELPAGSAPAGITTGPEGDLWFTESGGEGAIGRITPSGEVTEFTTGLTPNSQPDGIAKGAEGDLWFTQLKGSGAIGRITPSGVITEFTTGLTPERSPEGITAGPDGNIWFTESANPGGIGRITPAGVITEFTTGMKPAAEPRSITAANDGNLYFTEPNTAEIGEITTSGVITERETPTSESLPEAIVTGPDGNLWFTEHANPGRIARITVAPGVSSETAAATGEQTATLDASVGANSQATSYQFEYGTTGEYGSQTPTTSAGDGATSVPVSAELTGLKAGTLYHFRLVATNSAGTSYGPDATFTTAAPVLKLTSNVFEGPPKAGSSAAPPVLGKTALARPVSGIVLMRLPGAASFTRMGDGVDIPIGATVDATHGRLLVTTALDRLGHVQSASVWGGTFVLDQTSSGHGMTTFVDATGRPAACAAHLHHSAGRASAARARKKPKPSRTLWSSDDNGRYSTRGQNSVATVRGTYWGTIETCRGTVTIVRRGLVSVRSLHTHRTVLVRAGHSYLAKG
jgi:streptogramin lyase